MNDRRMAALAGAGIFAGLVVLISGIVAASGLYNVGADVPHLALTRGFLEFVRERSIDVHLDSVAVPQLRDPHMIADGASDYDAMCTACHLAPGMAENEMRPGMNPRPPVLWREPVDEPAEQFWVIKHGIKMTGMPAWGVTHSDQEIWNMVAFLQILPSLSPQRYHALTMEAAGHHDHDHMNMEN